ncbi:MAG TPA: NADH-quinone oxidoreductase subunit M [Candidatus Paceibacterota bacterium]|nr:NADH-quinone oxidoreductase subunit M [Verrucomicrobiota bacterium]HRY49233.1 NADH-quinone oxidoreductase subunit M [Candidatus Paceibacterota bacterium]HSA00213.1 NADH-quinone oxidoreductase subunit M [Candidatus Paceibacterota bacterium]
MGLLSLIILVPVVALIVVLCLPAGKDHFIKWTALLAMGVNVVLSTFLLVDYLGLLKTRGMATATDGSLRLDYVERFPWLGQLGIEYYVGVDGISVLMIFLTAVVIFCGVCASWRHTHRVREFFVFLLLLVTGVFGVFAANDLFLFFLFYEVAVLPMYLLIGLWGTGPKEYSAMKLTLMLMGGSALIVVGILVMYFESGSTSFAISEIARHGIPRSTQLWLFPLMFFGFGTLGGLWPFHTWSPDGHASAPTAVSMLHAGVLMKLGGYGCLKTVYLMPEGALFWSTFFLALTTINIFYGALVATQKTDLKYITAYSSVSHCGLVLFGLATLNPIACQGAMVQMYAHGLMTALFFALVGMIYGRTHTRFVTEMGGLLKVMPFLGVAYFIGGLSGLGLPGLAGFVAEIQVFIGAFALKTPWHRVMTVLAAASVVISAVYLLRALTRMFYGPLAQAEHGRLNDATFVEKVPLAILVFLLAFSGIFPGWMIRMIEYSMSPVLAQLQQFRPPPGL